VLLLVRHGQTDANAARLIQGRRDPDLTDLGRRQAAAVAEAVPQDAVGVVSSPLRRARLTAEALRRPVDVDGRWTEMASGDLEGRRVDEVRDFLWERWLATPEWAPPGGGESLADASRRVAAACEELAPRFAAGDLIVVTHVGPIKAAVAWALGVGPQISPRMFVAVASITTLGINAAGDPVLLSFSETGHLADL
jgi:broad specificity phosphatase PhoE